jgi:hypothetical protein
LADELLLEHQSTVDKQIKKDLSESVLAILEEMKLANFQTKETIKLLKNHLKNWQGSNKL